MSRLINLAAQLTTLIRTEFAATLIAIFLLRGTAAIIAENILRRTSPC